MLKGLRVVISAGPTFEDIDPVRFIGNRSSGKMGFALAAAAVERCAQVVLVAGPVALPTPEGVAERIDVRSAQDMHDAVFAAMPADIYIGAAAVADYRPREILPSKLKKGDGILQLELVRTADIIADLAVSRERPRLVVGFAAETHDLEHYAQGKLRNKGLDLIVANRVGIAGNGFESDDNTVTVFWPDGRRNIGPLPKRVLADALLDKAAERHAQLRDSTPSSTD